MKIPGRWNIQSVMSKAMMGLVLAAMIGSMDVVPAIAKEGHDRKEKKDDRRYESRGRGHAYGRDRNRRVYRTNVYSERVYAPTPVFITPPPPPPPPGISIFFPPLFIRP